MFIKTLSIETKTLSQLLCNEILFMIDNWMRTAVFKERQKSLENLIVNKIYHTINYTYFMCSYYYIRYFERSNVLEVLGRHSNGPMYRRTETVSVKPGFVLEIIQERQSIIDFQSNSSYTKYLVHITKPSD